jgi:hypothetical protein
MLVRNIQGFNQQSTKIEQECPAPIWVDANLKHDGLSRFQTPCAGHVQILTKAAQGRNFQQKECPAPIWVSANLRHDGLNPWPTPCAGHVQILAEAVQKYNVLQKENDMTKEAKEAHKARDAEGFAQMRQKRIDAAKGWSQEEAEQNAELQGMMNLAGANEHYRTPPRKKWLDTPG